MNRPSCGRPREDGALAGSFLLPRRRGVGKALEIAPSRRFLSAARSPAGTNTPSRRSGGLFHRAGVAAEAGEGVQPFARHEEVLGALGVGRSPGHARRAGSWSARP